MKPLTNDNEAFNLQNDDDTFILKGGYSAVELESDSVPQENLKITTFEMPCDIDCYEESCDAVKEPQEEGSSDLALEFKATHFGEAQEAVSTESADFKPEDSTQSDLESVDNIEYLSVADGAFEENVANTNDETIIDYSAQTADNQLSNENVEATATHPVDIEIVNNAEDLSVIDEGFVSDVQETASNAEPADFKSENSSHFEFEAVDNTEDISVSSDAFEENIDNINDEAADTLAQTTGDKQVSNIADINNDVVFDYSAQTGDKQGNDNFEVTATQPFTIAIVGLGLIGGSLGRAFIKRTDYTVLGRDVDSKTERTACYVKAITKPLHDEDLSQVDILIFATNPRTTIELLPQYVSQLKNGCVVLDVGGVKHDVVDAMYALSEHFGHLQFVSTHPMAGREVSGIKYSIASLFDGASIILTNVNATDSTYAMLEGIFTEIGFNQSIWCEADKHDKIIAYTSQSCHAISSAFCLNSLADKHKGFSAGSFKDLTRVARLNPDMWTELFCDNADNLSDVLGEFIDTLTRLKAAIETKDEITVKDILIKGNEKKESL